MAAIHAQASTRATVVAERGATELLKEGRHVLKGAMYPNMDELPELSMGTVLANCETLYFQEQHDKPGGRRVSKIYSQVGPVLIAMNPFKELNCYSACWQDAFRAEGRAGRITSAWKTLGPHCYGTIEEVYQGLRLAPYQSVVICGESGAGKTVTNGKMLEYLLDMGAGIRTNAMMGSKTGDSNRKLQLQAANELLEAFGNAKTGRNDNSSRFGKYSQLYFEGDPLVVTGLKVDHYLLERSRLVYVPPGERNYHIIHMLAKQEERSEEFPLEKPKFKYIKDAADVRKVDGGDFEEVKAYKELVQLMGEAGFDATARDDILNSIKGVMYLGNVDFECPDAPTLTNFRPDRQDSSIISAKSKNDFRRAARLLGLDDAEKFGDALTQKIIRAEGKDLVVNLNPKDSTAQRDAVAKTVYSRIFDDIVGVLNARLNPSHTSYSERATIGLLDIFGFEDMPINGFEQLFINLTNEWIQFHFNNVMFKRELEVYKEEDIDITFQRPDNWQCVELFIAEKPAGLIKLLQDRVVQPGAKDGEVLVDSVFNRNLKGRPHYTVCDPGMMRGVLQAKQPKWPKVKIDVHYKECFQVDHYAGPVLYTVKDFLTKSKDSMADHLVEALKASSSEKVRALFTEREDVTMKTVGQTFRQQLKGLMDTLEKSSCLFVRCIKPNPEMKPGIFDERLVLEQLTCGGVVSALQMRQAGLPDRMEYNQFMNEFWCLEYGRMEEIIKRERLVEPKVRCRDLMATFAGPEDANPPVYRLGIKKVFMRSGVLQRLRDLLILCTGRCARTVQRKWRAKKGLQVVRLLEQSRERLEAIREDANRVGVCEVRTVAESFKRVEHHLNGHLEKLEKDSANWERVKNIQGNGQEAINLTRTEEQAASKVMYVVSAADIDRVNRLLEDANSTTKKAAARKEAAEKRISELIVQKKQDLNALYERLLEVSTACTNQQDPEQKIIRDQVDEAKAWIDKVVQQELPAMHAEILAGVDLCVDAPKIDLPVRAQKLIEDSAAKATACEKAGGNLVEKRKRFEFETLQASPELQVLQKKREAAKERLELLEGDAREAARDGLDIVSKALEEVWRWDAEIESQFRAAAAPAKFVEAIKAFLAAEQTVQEAVEKVKRLEKECREREANNMQQVIAEFGKAAELQQLASTVIDLLMEFKEDLDQKLQDASSKEGRAPGLQTLDGTREVVGERLSAAAEMLEAIGFEVQRGKGDGLQMTATGQIRFHYDGDWSPECFKLLGPDVTPYQDIARVLDEERFHGVVDSVEALNAGVVEIQGGLCIAWSETWGQYYLLFHKDKEAEAEAAIKTVKKEQEVLQSRARLARFQKTVTQTMGVVQKDRWQEMVQQNQEKIEQKIRESVQKDLQQSIATKAAAEVAAKTARVMGQAQQEIAAAESLQKKKLSELVSRLKVHEDRSGVHGDLPQLFSEMADVCGHCQKLNRGFDDLRAHVALQREDVNEALAYVEALTHNPDTLPGLRELVEALQRCQRRQAESEKVGKELGLEPQNIALADLREEMVRVQQRCKRMLDGTVTVKNGIMAEIDGLRQDLSSIAKGYGQLQHGSEKWVKRLEDGERFVEQAQAQVDIRTESPVFTAKPFSKKTLWDKMMTGVFENFCATERPMESKALRSSQSSGSSQPPPPVLRLAGAQPVAAQSAAQQPLYPISNQTNPHLNKHIHKKKNAHSQYSKEALRGSMMQAGPGVGDYVFILPGKQVKGTVRFVGNTNFAAGEWVGVELDGPYGKNDGCVNGDQYFQCKHMHGLFLRPNMVLRVTAQDLESCSGRNSMLAPLTRSRLQKGVL